MASRTTVTLEDDLGGGPAEQTVRFALGNAEYEIDLNARNADWFRSTMAPFVDHARRASRGPRPRSVHPVAVRQHSAEIRAWAREHGIKISERGRIAATVIE